MKLDERDEALGATLDRSFEGARPISPPEPTSVMRRGTRRRASVLVGSLAMVAVFVGAIGFASSQFGQDASTAPAAPAAPTILVAPDIPWTMPIPPGWTAGGYRFAGGERSMLKDVRASFASNHAVDYKGWPSLGPLPPGVTNDTVIVLTDQSVGLGDPTPSGSITFNQDHEDRENPGWIVRDAKVCQLDDCVRVYVWYGPAASMGDLELAKTVAEGVRPGRSLPSPARLSPQVVFEDLADRFTMSYPAGWTVAGSSLTPGLVDPVEIVSVGTFAMQPGGRAGIDANLPGYALEHVGPDDVFITVQEFRETHWANPRPRPTSFDPEVWCRDAACVDGTRQELDPLRSWWIPFQDAGRGFVAFAAMGERAAEDEGIAAATWATLDSLSFQGVDGQRSADEPVELPPPTQDDYRSEFVSDERGYRFWPISAPIETGVVYRYAVPHCGLDWMVDIDGSFWEGRAIIFGNDWVAADEIPHGEAGTIELRRGVRYESPDGTWTLLSRVDGPIVRHPCE